MVMNDSAAPVDSSEDMYQWSFGGVLQTHRGLTLNLPPQELGMHRPLMTIGDAPPKQELHWSEHW